MDFPAAATNGSHQRKLSAGWGDGAGIDGSITAGQEQNGRVASSQCKIAAAHSAQMGGWLRCSCWALPEKIALGSQFPVPERKDRRNCEIRSPYYYVP